MTWMGFTELSEERWAFCVIYVLKRNKTSKMVGEKNIKIDVETNILSQIVKLIWTSSGLW
jgi:hypothetical protein